MIPKASQRSGGQDLATHLLNALDNEYVEVAEVSGAVAPDLHGAFAEWEAIASGLTKCRKYLYSLSVNPDLGQGELTRAQYLDYVDRAEKKLGLEGQPRAVVFHIKEGREHCHAGGVSCGGAPDQSGAGCGEADGAGGVPRARHRHHADPGEGAALPGPATIGCVRCS